MSQKNINIVKTITEQFLAKFSYRCISFSLDLKKILKIYSKLSYIMIKIKLVIYLKHCLNKFNAQNYANLATIKLKNFYKIFDNSKRIKKYIVYNKTLFIYNRIIFFNSVEIENKISLNAFFYSNVE